MRTDSSLTLLLWPTPASLHLCLIAYGLKNIILYALNSLIPYYPVALSHDPILLPTYCLVIYSNKMLPASDMIPSNSMAYLAIPHRYCLSEAVWSNWIYNIMLLMDLICLMLMICIGILPRYPSTAISYLWRVKYSH